MLMGTQVQGQKPGYFGEYGNIRRLGILACLDGNDHQKVLAALCTGKWGR